MSSRGAAGIGGWLAIGVGIGVALGVSLDNLALWIAIGAAIGLLIGYGQNARRERGS